MSGQLGYVLSHHHLDLVLDLRPDVSRDVIGQLIGGALEAVDHLLELADHGVACLLLPLLPVLHVSVQLLDVCEEERVDTMWSETNGTERRKTDEESRGDSSRL